MFRAAFCALLASTIVVGCGGSTQTVIIETRTVTAAASSNAGTTTITSSSVTPNSGHIYIYALVGVGGDPEEQPKQVTFAADGNNSVAKLQWQGWGSPAALATGVDHVNSCVPNCAQGSIQQIPATVTVSRPGSHAGRHMYLCYRLVLVNQAGVAGSRFCESRDPAVPQTTKCGPGTFWCPVEVDCPMTSAGVLLPEDCYGTVGISGHVPMPTPGPDHTGLGLNCVWSEARPTTDHRAYAYVCDPGP